MSATWSVSSTISVPSSVSIASSGVMMPAAPIDCLLHGQVLRKYEHDGPRRHHLSDADVSEAQEVGAMNTASIRGAVATDSATEPGESEFEEANMPRAFATLALTVWNRTEAGQLGG